MIAEPWISKLGNQVSRNFKNALHVENSKNFSSSLKKQGREVQQEKRTIGILSFEIANVMSKIIHLHKSLADKEISVLKREILKCVKVKLFVSDDDDQLLELAVMEKLEDLNRVASVASRLGKKCTVPALQGFEHVYGDIISRRINVRELGFLVKDMDGMVKKLERYVSSTASLYSELEVLNELELAAKKFQQNNNEESRKAFEQKVVWQKEDVNDLKNDSLWNQTYDKAIELLARSVCTIYARITVVFGDVMFKNDSPSGLVSGVQIGASRVLHSVKHSTQADTELIYKGDMVKPVLIESKSNRRSGFIERTASSKGNFGINPYVGPRRSEGGLFGPDDFNFACGIGPRRLFMGCLSLSNAASKVDEGDDDDDDDRSSQIAGCVTNGAKREQPDLSCCFNQPLSSIPLYGDHRQSKGAPTNASNHGTKSRILVHASPGTVGGSALALHYANIIIMVEKLLRCPHLVGQEARDDLYLMLPTSLRTTLKTRSKSYFKSLAKYDAPLAHDWKTKLEIVLEELAPLAHNMIRWQSERNFEQHQVVNRTNVLLIQTLYFADRIKTEEAICELLVGLIFICRYEKQKNALLDCTSSFDLEGNMDWQ